MRPGHIHVSAHRVGRYVGGTVAAPTITCPLGALVNGNDTTITITVEPTATGTLTATTTVTGAETDPATGNNTDTIYGGTGNDTCIVDTGDTTTSC